MEGTCFTDYWPSHENVASRFSEELAAHSPACYSRLLLKLDKGLREKNFFMGQTAMVIRVKGIKLENKNGKLLHEKVRGHSVSYN